MATGRTISASFLTDLDHNVIELCGTISAAITESIKDESLKRHYNKEYGKISFTRDGGLGLGGGKLQRDAICTRGRQGKAPFSNRNLRWHPLVVAEHKPNFANKIEKIEIEGEDDAQILVFVIKDLNGRTKRYPADKVHELEARYVALPEDWYPHINILKHWSDTLWTQNSCVIPALEACNWWDSLETYAVLAMALAVDIYHSNFDLVYKNVRSIIHNHSIDDNVKLPSSNFPSAKYDIVGCPVCRLSIAQGLDNFRKSDRGSTWQPAWRSSKKEEGDDSSTQIMHVNPLLENEIRHNAKNVRYGHRWCNVAMTDHSLEETLDFMEFIIKAHNRIK